MRDSIPHSDGSKQANALDTLESYPDPAQTIDPRAVRGANESEDDAVATLEVQNLPVANTDSATVGDTKRASSQSNRTGVIEAICSEFHSACSESSEPKIESFVPEFFADAERAVLIERLMLIELSILKKSNQPIDTTKYLSRFPADQAAIESAFRKLDSYSLESTLAPALSQPHSKTAMTSFASSITGNALHRYQPLRLHASGGLGEVYLAKDNEIGRLVALKEMRSKQAKNHSSQERFLAEAIVTGSLEHPGIVPIYGLGRHHDGRPYYAMRFIEGQSFQKSINDFHKAHPTRQRIDYYSRPFKALLRTLIEMSRALFYAHEHGVLHRDIKPENVMSGKFGETMIVDWGLAKVLHQTDKPDQIYLQNPLLAPEGEGTMAGTVMGTPSYMSPEQALGRHDKLTAAADIYSLGATLFTMLTNESPIDGRSSMDVVLNVRKGQIRKVESIAPQAPPALISICRQAMAIHPEDRYQTAGQFVDDIDRWLADDAVDAHKQHETRIEKYGRLVRRYHTWAVAGGLFLVAFTLLSVIAGLTINQARRKESLANLQAQAAKAEALARYQQSRQAIDAWLVGTNDALQFFPGTQPVRERLLQLALADYQALADGRADDADLELERARANIRLGDIQKARQAMPQARSRYQQAATILNELPYSQTSKALRVAELANITTRIGTTYYLEGMAHFADAEKQYLNSIQQLQSIKSDATHSDLTIRYLAATQLNLAELQYQQHRFDELLSTANEAIKTYKSLWNDDAAVVDSLNDRQLINPQSVTRDRLPIWIESERARELHSRADRELGRLKEADASVSDVVDRLASQLNRYADEPALVDALALALTSQAATRRLLGRQTGVEESLQAALVHFTTLATALPDVPRYKQQTAIARMNLGLAKLDAGRADLAVEILTDAAEAFQDLAIDHGQFAVDELAYATCEDGLAQAVFDSGAEANIAMQHAANAIETLLNSERLENDNPEVQHRLAIARSHAAQLQVHLMQYENAQLLFDAAITGLQFLIDNAPDTKSYQSSLAHVYTHRAEYYGRRDNVGSAKADLQRAIDLFKKSAATSAQHAVSLAIIYLAGPVIELRNPQSAVEAAALATSQSSDYPSERSHAILAMALMLNGQLADALPQMAILDQQQAEPTALSLLTRALALKTTNQVAAKQFLEEALKLAELHQSGNREFQSLEALVSENVASSR